MTHCRYSYESTAQAITDFLQYTTSPPRTVMTSEAAQQYEDNLIEAAKQQSLREMVGNNAKCHQYALKMFENFIHSRKESLLMIDTFNFFYIDICKCNRLKVEMKFSVLTNH